MPIPLFTVIPSTASPTTFAADMDAWLAQVQAWTAAANAMAAAMGVAGGTLGTNVAPFLATPSSANLLAAMTDKTGTGLLVFGTSPTLTTPNLGTPSAGVLSNCTGAVGYGLKSATTTVAVSAATAPTAGQVLTASSSTLAAWATPVAQLNTITAAGASATLANAANPITWNWALTGASNVGFKFGETAASTGGAGSQDLLRVETLSGSTANPFRVQNQGVDVIFVNYLGNISIAAPQASVLGTGCPLVLSAGKGAGANAAGGAISITGGSGVSTGTGGAVALIGGPGDSGSNGATGGSASIIGGNASGAATGTGGDVNITTGTGATANGKVSFTNCNVANGAVGTTFTGVGPTGAATTIQGWLAIKVGGTARFVPFW